MGKQGNVLSSTVRPHFCETLPAEVIEEKQPTADFDYLPRYIPRHTHAPSEGLIPLRAR